MIRRLLAAARVRQQHQQQHGSWQVVLPSMPRALLVLPYVSIVSEKTEHLAHVLAPVRGFKVRGYTGSEQASAPLSAPVSCAPGSPGVWWLGPLES